MLDLLAVDAVDGHEPEHEERRTADEEDRAAGENPYSARVTVLDSLRNKT